MSCRHVSCVSQLPLQQSHEALQLIVCNLHTSPFGLQPVGLRHTPRGPPPEKSHVTFPAPGPGNPADPQQSKSCAHTSPTTWHPLAGWQIRTPVGPYGAQRRLQHEPPHAGSGPVAAVTTPPQTVPSTIEQLAAPEGGWPHVPYSCPAAIVQSPPQQSDGDPHASPLCPQNDEAWHVPLLAQNIEQHPEFCVHELPTVVQLVLSGVHVPAAPHIPLQHCALPAHAWPSEVHAGKTQTPLLHVPLQQSLGWEHAPPRLRQLPGAASGWKGLASDVVPPPSLVAVVPSPPESPPIPAPASAPPESAPPLLLAPLLLAPPLLDPPLLDCEEESTVPSLRPPSSPFVTVALWLPHPTVARTVARSAIFTNAGDGILAMTAAPWGRTLPETSPSFGLASPMAL